MLNTQEPKYDCTPEGKLVNRSTHHVIPDDEPVFIIRAKDRNAVAALQAYRDLCQNADHKAVIKSRILDFAAFAADHPERMKEPDASLQDLISAKQKKLDEKVTEKVTPIDALAKADKKAKDKPQEPPAGEGAAWPFPTSATTQ